VWKLRKVQRPKQILIYYVIDDTDLRGVNFNFSREDVGRDSRTFYLERLNIRVKQNTLYCHSSVKFGVRYRARESNFLLFHTIAWRICSSAILALFYGARLVVF
jgi:hypothetical protein